MFVGAGLEVEDLALPEPERGELWRWIPQRVFSMDQPAFLLDWVCNDGGPFLLIPQKHLQAWEGTVPPSNGRVVQAQFRYDPTIPATDYDRACDVEDYLGLLAVGEGTALVLGDEPVMTAWLPKANGGILIRWRYANSEADILAALNSVGPEAFTDSGLELEIDDTRVILMSACDRNQDFIYGFVEITIEPAKYRIFTSEYVNESTAILLHWLIAAQ